LFLRLAFANPPAVRHHRYTRHAARSFFALLLLGGVPVGIGNSIDPRRGAAFGFLMGLLLLVAYAAWRTWRYRRGLAWVEVAKQSGLRPIYHRDPTDVPLPEFQVLGNLVGGNLDGMRVLIADRMEQFLIDHVQGSIGTIDFNRTEVSAPIAEETFVAIWVPGLTEEWWSLGKRRSLLAGDRIQEPSEACVAPLKDWLRAHPGWRLEGVGDMVAAFRPGHVAPTGSIPDWVAIGRQLGKVLGQSPSLER
jgi:uncharacterized protein YfiM (DUF2279 family)